MKYFKKMEGGRVYLPAMDILVEEFDGSALDDLFAQPRPGSPAAGKENGR